METNNIYTRNVLVTPEYAKRLLQKNVANRPLTQKTVDWYAYQMSKGQWTVSGQTISISDKDTLPSANDFSNVPTNPCVHISMSVPAFKAMAEQSCKLPRP